MVIEDITQKLKPKFNMSFPKKFFVVSLLIVLWIVFVSSGKIILTNIDLSASLSKKEIEIFDLNTIDWSLEVVEEKEVVEN